MPTATTYEELKKQLGTIEAYSDRGTLEKDFLKNKVTNRYWVGQINDRAGTDELVKFIGATEFDYTKIKDTTPFNYLVRGDFGGELKDESYDDAYFDVLKSDPDAEWKLRFLPFSVPWGHKDEGMVPDDIPERMSEYTKTIETAYSSFTESFSEHHADFLEEEITLHHDSEEALKAVEYKGNKYSPEEFGKIIENLAKSVSGKKDYSDIVGLTPLEKARALPFVFGDKEIQASVDKIAEVNLPRYTWLQDLLEIENPASTKELRNEALNWMLRYLNGEEDLYTKPPIIPETPISRLTHIKSTKQTEIDSLLTDNPVLYFELQDNLHSENSQFIHWLSSFEKGESTLSDLERLIPKEELEKIPNKLDKETRDYFKDEHNINVFRTTDVAKLDFLATNSSGMPVLYGEKTDNPLIRQVSEHLSIGPDIIHKIYTPFEVKPEAIKVV